MCSKQKSKLTPRGWWGDLNETEVILPDKEFKIRIIKMLTELWENM